MAAPARVSTMAAPISQFLMNRSKLVPGHHAAAQRHPAGQHAEPD